DGIHTPDIYRDGFSVKKVGTQEFTQAVIDRLEGVSSDLGWVRPTLQATQIEVPAYERPKVQKQLLGVDLFVDWTGDDPQEIGEALDHLAGADLKLKMITNRGVKVYPEGLDETFCTDHWRCRFVANDAVIHPVENIYMPIHHKDITQLIDRLNEAGWEVIKSENLYSFDGERGFSLGQGE
ncbi:MAG: NADP-dependent isocitrate dehydrogenase, partial [Bacteroidota bacterium]